MPNSNYRRGRTFEYERMKYYKEVMKNDCLRTAGSHGAWDLIAIDHVRGLITLIQCKVCKDAGTGLRLLERFRANPPYAPMAGVYQVMEVKVVGSREVLSATV